MPQLLNPFRFKGVDALKYEMETGNDFRRGEPKSHDNSGKINATETTEQMLEWFSEFEINRLKVYRVSHSKGK